MTTFDEKLGLAFGIISEARPMPTYDRQRVIDLIQAGGSIRSIAIELGLGEHTLKKLIVRDLPEYLDVIKANVRKKNVDNAAVGRRAARKRLETDPEWAASYRQRQGDHARTWWASLGQDQRHQFLNGLAATRQAWWESLSPAERSEINRRKAVSSWEDRDFWEWLRGFDPEKRVRVVSAMFSRTTAGHPNPAPLHALIAKALSLGSTSGGG